MIASSYRFGFTRCVGILLLALGLGAVGAMAQSPGWSKDDGDFSDKLLQFGTGPEGGSFRPMGTALCNAVNEERRNSMVRCVPMATAGSPFNIQALIDGSLQLAMAQEDLVAKAVADTSEKGGQALRVVAVLHNSPIAVVARNGSGIQKLSDIAGKAVNLGNRGSGQYVVMEGILRALGLGVESLAKVSYASTSDFERLFCDGRVDVVVEAVAHPAAVFGKLLGCGGVFIELPPDVQQRMMQDNPYLSAMEIPAFAYPGQTSAVSTVGMRNILMTSSAVSPEAIYRFTTILKRKFPQAQSEVKTLKHVQVSAFAERLPAPLHAGSQRAYGLNLQ